MRLLCFFGSGISRESGLPMVAALTSAILDGYWRKESDGLYRSRENEFLLEPRDVMVRAFIRLLAEKASTYLQRRNTSVLDYERLFDLAKRIESECMRLGHDPAIGPFVRELVAAATGNGLFAGCEAGPLYDRNVELKMGAMASESQTLIQSAVKILLGAPATPRGFDALVGLCRKSRFQGIDMVTLNHDLLLERLFAAEGIAFEDGFSDVDGRVRYFDQKKLRSASTVRLLKPHGSINWFRVPRRVSHGWVQSYGAPVDPAEQDHLRTADGTLLQLAPPDPEFITGVQKTRLYLSGLYGIQVTVMRELLLATRRVMCCGYGWRDEGMNRILFEWLNESVQNRMVILHPNADEELFRSENSFWHHAYERLSRVQLHVHPDWLCNSTSEQLSGVL